jgi:hypothetical protein
VQPNLCSFWHTGLSGGARDSVRCARLASGEQVALGRIWRRTAIIHRTVQWCTGLSGEPTAASATVGRATRGRHVARANGRHGTPDCPVCTGHCPVCTGQCLVLQPPRICNGCFTRIGRRSRTNMNSGCSVVHRTVRCATRQKARIAFLVDLQRLLATLGL